MVDRGISVMLCPICYGKRFTVTVVGGYQFMGICRYCHGDEIICGEGESGSEQQEPRDSSPGPPRN